MEVTVYDAFFSTICKSLHSHLFTLGMGHSQNKAFSKVSTFETDFKTLSFQQHTPNANMADHSEGAWEELHESEAGEALVFWFDNASPEKCCFVEGLVCCISLCLRVFEFLNATRRE